MSEVLNNPEWPVIFEASRTVHEGIKRIFVKNPVISEEGKLTSGTIVVEYNDGATFDYGEINNLDFFANVSSLYVDDNHMLHTYTFLNGTPLKAPSQSGNPDDVLATNGIGGTYWKTIS